MPCRSCTALTDYPVEHPEADPATWRDFDIAATRILDSIIKSKLYDEAVDQSAVFLPVFHHQLEETCPEALEITNTIYYVYDSLRRSTRCSTAC